MRSRVRVSFVALLTGVLVSLVAVSAAQAVSFGVERFVATNCKAAFKKCGSEESAGPLGTPYSLPKAEVTVAEAREQGFTEAGGRVPNGVTDFKVNTEGVYPNAKPVGAVDHVRVDVATGLATAPDAVPMCPIEEFGNKEALAGTGFYEKPKCETDTEIGEEKVTLYVEALKEDGFTDLPVEGKVYNLKQPAKLASYYGVALEFPQPVSKGLITKSFAEHPLPLEDFPTGKTKAEKEAEKAGTEKALEEKQYFVHSFVKGSIEWGKEAKGTDQGDYHDYFEVEASPASPLISSRQVLYGTTGHDFITNATSCPGDDTTYVTLEDTAGEVTRKSFTTPIGLEGCKNLVFGPTFKFESGSSASDEPNPVTTDVSDTDVPTERAPSQVKTASITLPEGMTLDPSAAHGLEACTVGQARIHSAEFGVACPSGSELGTVSLDVPTLPEGSFTGHVYLGGPLTGSETGPITGPPYIIYVVANSEQYGISVRIKGEVIPNETTGQVTTVFNENPQQPFTSLTISFNRNVLTSLANPLACGEPAGSASFTPVAGEVASASEPFKLAILGCASSIPFALAQSAENETSTAGGHTSYTVNYARNNGEQYLQKIKTTLPSGLVGAIPAVTLCAEANANAGTCGVASKIGNVTVQAGSGSAPYTFTGSVYMTGPYGGAPFGMSIVVPAIAGPFNLGNVVTRGTININQTTAQVTAESTLPTIYKGIPLRLRAISVDVNRQGFLYNPTNCSALATESSLTSTSGTVQSSLSTPFQVEACSALAFKPVYAYSTSAKHSKSQGASLVTTVTQPAGQANIKSVLVTLPKALPSRLSTLQKACLAKTFEENPFNCRKEQGDGSEVGSAEVVTPLLPVVMKGPAFLVSHAGEEFPSLELVLEGDGVRVILEGKTHITKGITTTNFESTPDVPISSVTVKLPLGPHSALTTERLNTNLCTTKLLIPTVVTGQNGKQNKYSSVITPTGCGVQIVGHKVVGNTAYITVETYAAGRVSGGGSGLSTRYRTFTAAKKAVLIKVPLSARGRSRRRPFKVKLRVGFVPKKGAHSSTTVTVKFR